jgi:periplasmic divalent cation tolerance protein
MEIREVSNMTEYVVALTTCPTDKSRELGDYLVKARVCACVNIIPKVLSIYHWKGDIVTEDESILIMKTRGDSKEKLWTSLKEKHPYEVPEFVVLEIQWGSKDYLNWISSSINTME